MATPAHASPRPGAATRPARPAIPRAALPWIVAGAVLAGILAYVEPLAGIALAVLALAAVLVRDVPVPRLAVPLVLLTAVAAVLGPNLAAPAAPEVFGFRVLIVLVGLGLLGYLLLEGRLPLPAGLPRPAALAGVLLLWAALSIGWSENVLAALRWTAFLAMMTALALGIAMLCRSRRGAVRVLVALGVTFVLACLVAVVEVVAGVHLPTFRSNAGDGGLFGAGSFFGNQNNFAIYLALTLPYLAVLPIVFRDARLRAIGAGGSAVALLFLLTTGSKSGLLSAALILVGLLVLVGADRRSRGRLASAGAMAALAVLVVVPALAGYGPIALDERIVTKLDFGILASQVEYGTGSGGVRSSLLSEGLALVDETYGRGVGAGNAETRVQSLAQFPGVANLHNWWLEVLVNLGVVGFAVYLAFYLTLLRRNVRTARRTTDGLVRYMSLASALALVALVTGSLGPSTAIHFTPMWIAFGLAMGALVLARREAP